MPAEVCYCLEDDCPKVHRPLPDGLPGWEKLELAGVQEADEMILRVHLEPGLPAYRRRALALALKTYPGVIRVDTINLVGQG